MQEEEFSQQNPLEDYRRNLLDFLSRHQHYYDSIEKIIEGKETRLQVNLDHLREI